MTRETTVVSMHERIRVVEARSEAAFDPAHAAFILLRVGFGVLPIVVGIDKFRDRFTDWTQYLWVGVPHALHVSATTFMHGAGVVEIAAGVLVLVVPELGGALVAAWLAGIVANLVLVAYDEHEYWDIALRDAG